MQKNEAFILTLAYPETIVMVADEWYSKYLYLIGVGKKNYVRAGHAALVLISKKTGILEYHDFGRYITSEPFGRVRGRSTDGELHFPLKADIENDTILNLEDILKFLATHPKITHGEGKLVASVCKTIDYRKARSHIDEMQAKGFITYAAFKNEACNCARFVTDTLIASTNSSEIKKKLQQSKWFTPSTMGNVVIADTEHKVYEIDADGLITDFNTSVSRENRRLFLDRLDAHEASFEGTLEPKHNSEKGNHAQWLSGIAAGAWFELHPKNDEEHYRFRRISPYGAIDIDGWFKVDNPNFSYSHEFRFIHYSNCLFFHIEQQNQQYRFDFVRINED